jgi:hypothetical protein
MAHMHYKGTGKVHSFRGRLEDNKKKEISIEGAVGAIAWRITKFEIMPNLTGSVDAELVAKIYRENPGAVSAIVDFEDSELLGAAYFKINQTDARYGWGPSVIFDNALFVRNIFVTGIDTNASNVTNYYIELEEVKVSAAGMAQLAVAAARRTTEGGA